MAEFHATDIRNDQIAAILANLDDLLDKERSALLDGNLEAIVRGLREKERLIDTLRASHLDNGAILDPIRDKAARNQVLLDGALDGIRAVADRMAALRRIRDSLETYDQSGRKTAIGNLRPGQVEKRA